VDFNVGVCKVAGVFDEALFLEARSHSGETLFNAASVTSLRSSSYGCI